MKGRRFWLGLSLFFISAFSLAAELPAQQAKALLERIERSARYTEYQGVFVHQHAGRIESFRIAQGLRNGVIVEHCESLDGKPREYLRVGERYQAYHPDFKGLLPERRRWMALFPRLTHEIDDVLQAYRVSDQGSARVAGVDARVYQLEARDGLRYAHRLYVHPASGLLIKSVLFGLKGEELESHAFSQLRFGRVQDASALRAVNPLRDVPASELGSPAQGQALPAGWQVARLPAGFVLRKVQAKVPGTEAGKVVQLVYSDGLSSVSVFLDARPEVMQAGASQREGLQMFVRQVKGGTVSVLGEVHPGLVRHIAEQFNPR